MFIATKKGGKFLMDLCFMACAVINCMLGLYGFIFQDIWAFQQGWFLCLGCLLMIIIFKR